jgi:hypothetical protein
MKPESPTLQACRMSFFSFSRQAVELPRTSVCLYAAHSTCRCTHSTAQQQQRRPILFVMFISSEGPELMPR